MRKLSFFIDRSGVAAVEFALVAPILLFALVGIIDTALYIHDKMKVEAAARASVDYVIKSNGDDEALMMSVLSGYFDDGSSENTWQDALDYEVSLYCECASDGVEMDCSESCDAGDYKRRYFGVEVSKLHKTLMSYPGLPPTMTLQGGAKIRLD